MASEEGSMMVAVIVLLVVSTLAAAVVSAAVQTNTSSRHDANYKDASEAAEAGLQIALYRMNIANLSTNTSGCVGDTFLSTPNDGSWCQSSIYSLGNGASYQYYTTPVLSSNQTCVGETISGTDVTTRCVTAVGTANGVTARSQVKVSAFAAAPLFPISGVVGLNSVALSGNATVTGSSASNGGVTMNGNASSTGVILGPGGSYSHSGNSSGGTVTRDTSPLTLDSVNPGNSATSNDDYRITNGINNANGTNNPVVTPQDAATSKGVSFNSSTRVLSISGNGQLTLGGGLYNFCELDMSGNASLSIAAGVEAEIYVDSPDDPGSGCGSGTGNLNLSGNGAVNPSQNPLALQLYVFGMGKSTPNPATTATISGNGAVYGVLFAPFSAVTLSGNGVVSGAVAGETVNISGNGFNWDSRAGTIQAGTNGVYYRAAWAQCTPQPTTSDPGSGCG